MGKIPGSVIQDAYTDSLESQWALHLDYIKQNPGLEIKEFPKNPEAMKEMMSREIKSFGKYLQPSGSCLPLK